MHGNLPSSSIHPCPQALSKRRTASLEVGASRAHAHCHGKALHHLVLKFDLGELGEIC